MTVVCPKCNSFLQQEDDLNVPHYQCPNCGIIFANYAKVMKQQADARAVSREINKQLPNTENNDYE